MKKAILCCISCILPCGALDVIRIVHANGRVEEISGSIKASEIMKVHPKHVLKKPTSASQEGMCATVVLVLPDEELIRGKIYFLVPVPSQPVPGKKKKNFNHKNAGRSKPRSRKQKKEAIVAAANENDQRNGDSIVSGTDFAVSDRYLSEILSEKVSSQRDRRRGRVCVWRPHLESISETPVDV